MRSIDFEEARMSFAKDVKAGTAVVLVGAGASMVPPSSLPSGPQLRDYVLSCLPFSGVAKICIEQLRENKKYATLIPEVLFSDIHSVIGSKIFPAFRVLRRSTPNPVHVAMATFANEHGVEIFTTNFDQLIERNTVDKDKIVHLHGSLRDLSSLTVLLSQVGRPLSLKHQSRLNNNAGKNLYVFGYSGNDRDVISGLAGASFQSVFWLVRHESDDWVKRNIAQLDPQSLFVFYGDISTFFGCTAPATTAASITAAGGARAEEVAAFARTVSTHQCYVIAALVLYRLQEYRSAADVCAKALQLPKLPPRLKKRLLVYWAEASRAKGVDPQVILDFIGLRPNVSRSFHDAELSNTRGLLLLDLRRFDEALVQFELASSAFQQLVMRAPKMALQAMRMLSLVENNIGLARYEKGELRIAYAHFLQSMRLKRRMGHVLGEATGAVNLAMTAMAMSHLRRQRYWESYAIALCDKYGLHHRKVTLLRDLGDLLIRQGNFGAAEPRLREALRICDEYIGEYRERSAIVDLLSIVSQ